MYVHVPFCLFLCRFCDFVRTTDVRPETLAAAVAHTRTEIATTTARYHLRGIPIKAVYFGGGTASLLRLDQVAMLLDELYRYFDVEADAELTFEGECLSLLKRGYLDGLRELGFRRLSFGIQTVNETARAVLNLRPTLRQLQRLGYEAQDRFDEVSVDFIFGWPSQSAELATEDLARTLQLVPLTSVELFRFEKSDASPALMGELYRAGLHDGVTAELQAHLVSLTEVLTGHGLRRLSFSKFGHTARYAGYVYEQCYYGWGDGAVLGFGRGAQSFFGGAMWGNALSPTDYAATVTAGEVPIDAFAPYRRGEREAVTWPRRGHVVPSQLGAAADSMYRFRLDALERAGYSTCRDDTVALTTEGHTWVPSIMDYLMPPRQRAWRCRLARMRLGPRSLPAPAGTARGPGAG